MPAHEWEIREIISEGVEIHPSQGPKAILGDGKRVTGVEFIHCKSVLDANGRFNPVFDDKKTQTVEADMLISAIGQAPDLSFLGEDVGVFRGAVQVNPNTMETNLPGVYAGGDAVTGAATVILAMGAGKASAAAIDDYIKAKG